MSPRRLPLAGAPAPSSAESLSPARTLARGTIAVVPARDGIPTAAFAGALAAAASDAAVAVEIGGVALARTVRPWLTVVISAGVPRELFTGVARALADADEIDLVLSDARPALAPALVALVSARGAA